MRLWVFEFAFKIVWYSQVHDLPPSLTSPSSAGSHTHYQNHLACQALTGKKLKGREKEWGWKRERKRESFMCDDFMLWTQKSILKPKVYQYKLSLGYAVSLIFASSLFLSPLSLSRLFNCEVKKPSQRCWLHPVRNSEAHHKNLITCLSFPYDCLKKM